MRRSPFWKLVTCVACAGLVLAASPIMAAGSAEGATNHVPAAPVATDVALAGGGMLRGQVVDAKGLALKATPVSVWHANHQIAKATTDENGQFAVSGLRGGVHYVVAGQNYAVYRLWSAQSAPPAAQQGTVVVAGEVPVVRGQNGNLARGVLTSPVLWGGIMYATGHVIGFNMGLDRTPSSP